MVAAEAAARERDDRPPPAVKRMREWEAESGPSKKFANEETRAHLDDHMSRRVSPPGRMSSSTVTDFPRRSSSEIRRENERRVNENYHPSEVAHQPNAVPPQQIPSMQTMFEPAPKEDRPDPVEPAARRVEVDEDYDNNSEEEKRNTGSGGARVSPPNAPSAGPLKQEMAV
jgi:general transcriptional corepressor CYC8